jgi:hypothetical protein
MADDQLQELVLRPAESMAVELKTWFDPRTPEGVAKLVKSVFALANRNGGFLAIGFNDETAAPDPFPFDVSASEIFHGDTVQAAIMRYASRPLAVETHFRERDGQQHPLIVVPPGVRVPTVVKSDLVGAGGKRLLNSGDLFFRTLRANNTPSSARILPGDYGDLLEICFNNREADLGGFLRRQLGQTDLAAIATLLQGLGLSAPPAATATLRERAEEVIELGRKAFASAVMSREEVTAAAVQGLTMEVGLVLDPPRPAELPSRAFLERLAVANPNYTGWPIWLDSRGFHNEHERPVVKGGAWEALIVDLGGGWAQHLEFMRVSPTGDFYLRRAMQDDLEDKVPRGTALDMFLMLLRVTEVLAVGLSFAQALDWAADSSAGFAFSWIGLTDRKLSSWANPLRYMGSGAGRSAESAAQSFVAVPIGTPHGALAPYVSEAVAPLFSLFDGYQPPQAIVEDAVQRLVERRL